MSDVYLGRDERPPGLEQIASGKVRDYVQGLFEKDPELMARLARSDRCQPELYPGFEEFYKGLDTRLDRVVAQGAQAGGELGVGRRQREPAEGRHQAAAQRNAEQARGVC